MRRRGLGRALPPLLAAGCGLLTAFAAARAAVVPVDVSLSAEALVPRVEVIARPEPGPRGDTRSPVRATAAAPGRATLSLTAGLSWTISAEAPGYWAASRSLVPVGSGESLSFALLRSGAIQIALEPPRGEPLPPSVSVRFESTDKRAGGGIPRSETPCSPKATSWLCQVPGGRLDLRISAAGFLPQYRWAVDVPAGKTVKLGQLALLHGGAVTGSVQSANGTPFAPSCRVELLADADARPQAGGPVRPGGAVHSARPDARGFFEVGGLPPGSYVLTVRAPGMATTTLAPVVVAKDAEVAIEKPLLLVPPLRLDLEVDPPFDPRGRAWRAGLQRRDPTLTTIRDVAGGATEDGRFSARGLDPGTYRLNVMDSAGESFLSEEIHLETDQALRREISLIDVEGVVTKRETPFATDLRFINAGPLSAAIRMTSDEKGKFSGVLPQEGKWRIDLPALHRTLRDVQVKRAEGARAARLSLEIPDCRITGQVVDESSNLIAGASVSAGDLAGGGEQSAVTDGEGSFTIEGLDRTPHLVTAEAELAGHHLSSDPTNVSLGEANPSATVRLVLHEQASLDGIISSPTGPAAGAHLLVIPKGPLSSSTSEASSDDLGRFHLSIPAAANDLELLVAPPGFTFRVLHLTAPFPNPLPVQVDQEGGTLVIRTPPEDSSAGTKRIPLLLADGQPLPFSLLLAWAGSGGATASPGDPSHATRLLRGLPDDAPGADAGDARPRCGDRTRVRPRDSRPARRACSRPFGALSRPGLARSDGQPAQRPGAVSAARGCSAAGRWIFQHPARAEPSILEIHLCKG